MSEKLPEKSFTVRAPADVYEEFFQKSRKMGLSMAYRVLEFMHRDTGNPVPNPSRRGKRPQPKPRPAKPKPKG